MPLKGRAWLTRAAKSERRSPGWILSLEAVSSTCFCSAMSSASVSLLPDGEEVEVVVVVVHGAVLFLEGFLLMPSSRPFRCRLPACWRCIIRAKARGVSSDV